MRLVRFHRKKRSGHDDPIASLRSLTVCRFAIYPADEKNAWPIGDGAVEIFNSAKNSRAAYKIGNVVWDVMICSANRKSGPRRCPLLNGCIRIVDGCGHHIRFGNYMAGTAKNRRQREGHRLNGRKIECAVRDLSAGAVTFDVSRNGVPVCERDTFIAGPPTA